jgi:hypothetical protein
MKRLTIWLIEYQLKQAVKSAEKETNIILKKAKEHRVEAYKTTLLFLNP